MKMRLSLFHNVSRVHTCVLASNINLIRSLCVRHINNKRSIYKTEEAKKIRFYFVRRYLEYLKGYEKVLERSFPGAMRVYRVFSEGIRDFVRDVKDYVRIVRLLSTIKTDKFQNLSRKEIELYYQMPRDMRKIAPVLIISALPFANYIVFPLAYLLPRHLLCSHFWTLQQKTEFNIESLRNRFHYNRALFRCVQAQLDSLISHRLYDKFKAILADLGSGNQPCVEDILACRDLFMTEPYHIFYLRRAHVRYLLRIHDMHLGWFRRARLVDKAIILKEMDRALVREGGVESLHTDALKKCCIIRGLNPTNVSHEDMVIWLNSWLTISNTVDRENLSLLLHCPILLGYNQPSNWVLIYSKTR